jgi:hypothetical protein
MTISRMRNGLMPAIGEVMFGTQKKSVAQESYVAETFRTALAVAEVTSPVCWGIWAAGKTAEGLGVIDPASAPKLFSNPPHYLDDVCKRTSDSVASGWESASRGMEKARVSALSVFPPRPTKTPTGFGSTLRSNGSEEQTPPCSYSQHRGTQARDAAVSDTYSWYQTSPEWYGETRPSQLEETGPARANDCHSYENKWVVAKAQHQNYRTRKIYNLDSRGLDLTSMHAVAWAEKQIRVRKEEEEHSHRLVFRCSLGKSSAYWDARLEEHGLYKERFEKFLCAANEDYHIRHWSLTEAAAHGAAAFCTIGLSLIYSYRTITENDNKSNLFLDNLVSRYNKEFNPRGISFNIERLDMLGVDIVIRGERTLRETQVPAST